MKTATTHAARFVAGSTAVALTLGLAGCGSSEGDKQPSSQGSRSTSAPTAHPSATLPPDAAGTAKPATGVSMSGDGYSYRAPLGWQDDTAELKKSQPSVDTAVLERSPTGSFASNLNVISSTSPYSATPSEHDLARLQTELQTQVKTIAKDIKAMPRTSIKGATTLVQQGKADYSGAKYFLVQYIAVRTDKMYVLTFSFDRQLSAKDRQAIIQPVLASWSWS